MYRSTHCHRKNSVYQGRETYKSKQQQRYAPPRPPSPPTLSGDSLTRLSTTTLAAVLRAEPVTTSQLKDEWSACGGKLRVSFMRNDFLDVRTSAFDGVQCKLRGGKAADNTRCVVFAKHSTLENFDTLVVNSGAHPRPGEEYGPAMRVASESLAVTMKLLHGDDAVLIARNTVPGHWGCTER